MLRQTLVFALFGFAGASFAQSASYVQGELLVKFVPGQAVAINQAIGATEGSYNVRIGVSKVVLPAGMSVTQGLAYYRSKIGVSYADPNYIARAHWIPNDPMFAQQYGPQKIKCVQGWDVMKGSPSVTIAILDTGIDKQHVDLASKVVGGYDFINDDNDADDDNGHGTHVAGTAAGLTNNGIGIAGVAPNCTLMPVKVLSAGGSGSYEAVASGITFAADNGANVINMSLGGGGGTPALQDAVRYALSRNCVVTASAGNNGNTAPNYPGFYPECIAVASTNQNDQRSGFSTYGDWVDVAAPGSEILSTLPDNSYGAQDGTSMSSPHVAGLAGLIKSIWPAASNAQVRAQIENNCDFVGSFVIKGRINVLRSIPLIVTTDPYNLGASSLVMYEGVSTSGAVGTTYNSDNLYYRVNSKLIDRLGHTASVKAFFTSGKNPATFEQLSFKVETASATYVTGALFIWNTSTSRFDLIGSWPQTSVDSVKTFTMSKPYSRYFTPTRQAQILVRSIMPISSIRPSVPFTLKMDHIQLNARVPK